MSSISFKHYTQQLNSKNSIFKMQPKQMLEYQTKNARIWHFQYYGAKKLRVEKKLNHGDSQWQISCKHALPKSAHVFEVGVNDPTNVQSVIRII